MHPKLVSGLELAAVPRSDVALTNSLASRMAREQGGEAIIWRAPHLISGRLEDSFLFGRRSFC
jgi:hypothetical protein